LLGRYGVPELLALKQQVVDSTTAGRRPETMSLPNDRFARSTTGSIRSMPRIRWRRCTDLPQSCHRRNKCIRICKKEITNGSQHPAAAGRPLPA
jgi:hypothetical protein